MSRRTSRRRQQAKNEWRRTGRILMLLDAGIPARIAPVVWLIPPDPEKEREEFVRQLTERRPVPTGAATPMPGYLGRVDGISIVP